MGNVKLRLTRIFEALPSPIIKKTKSTITKKLNDIYYYKYAAELRQSNELLKEMNGKYLGGRCFIIATGPSLNKTNVSLIEDEILFGMNTLYKALDRFKKCPRYWGVVDSVVFKKHYKEILKLDTILFLAGSAGRYYLKNKNELKQYQKNNPIILKAGKDMNIWGEFSTNILKGANGAGSVTIDVCLQMTYHFGFKDVYIIGCDEDCTGNHFDGAKTQGKIYKPEKTFAGYEICKKAFENDGRMICNATAGGKLEVFERVKLEDVMA